MSDEGHRYIFYGWPEMPWKKEESMDHVYVVYWYDRRTDPFVDVFSSFGKAVVQIGVCQTWREYDWIDKDRVFSMDEEDQEQWEWLLNYPADYFVTASIDDGPHGWIKRMKVK